MDNSEPKMNFTMEDGTNVEATRYNTSLWSFLGRAALYDHVYVAANDDFSIYIFQAMPDFAIAAKFVIENEFPLHLHIPEPAEEDLEAYERFIQSNMTDLNSFPPKEWIPDE
jgi:hypothetical protein